VPVHYKGGGPAIQDLIGGQVQVMLIQGGGAIPQYVKTGKLVALAVSSLERSKFYPELPTIAETYPGFRVESVGRAVRPGGDPARRCSSRLHTELVKVVSDAAMKEKLEAQGCDVVGGPAETMAARVRNDQAKWSRIIREKNITIQ
jgi:tripartite-type tricarboxylate transporter receptor subunit TctC